MSDRDRLSIPAADLRNALARGNASGHLHTFDAALIGAALAACLAVLAFCVWQAMSFYVLLFHLKGTALWRVTANRPTDNVQRMATMVGMLIIILLPALLALLQMLGAATRALVIRRLSIGEPQGVPTPWKRTASLAIGQQQRNLGVLGSHLMLAAFCAPPLAFGGLVVFGLSKSLWPLVFVPVLALPIWISAVAGGSWLLELVAREDTIRGQRRWMDGQVVRAVPLWLSWRMIRRAGLPLLLSAWPIAMAIRVMESDRGLSRDGAINELIGLSVIGLALVWFALSRAVSCLPAARLVYARIRPRLTSTGSLGAPVTVLQDPADAADDVIAPAAHVEDELRFVLQPASPVASAIAIAALPLLLAIASWIAVCALWLQCPTGHDAWFAEQADRLATQADDNPVMPDIPEAWDRLAALDGTIGDDWKGRIARWRTDPGKDVHQVAEDVVETATQWWPMQLAATTNGNEAATVINQVAHTIRQLSWLRSDWSGNVDPIPALAARFLDALEDNLQRLAPLSVPESAALDLALEGLDAAMMNVIDQEIRGWTIRWQNRESVWWSPPDTLVWPRGGDWVFPSGSRVRARRDMAVVGRKLESAQSPRPRDWQRFGPSTWSDRRNDSAVHLSKCTDQRLVVFLHRAALRVVATGARLTALPAIGDVPDAFADRPAIGLVDADGRPACSTLLDAFGFGVCQSGTSSVTIPFGP